MKLVSGDQRWDVEKASCIGPGGGEELRLSPVIDQLNHALWPLLKTAFHSEQRQDVEGKNDGHKTKTSESPGQFEMMHFCSSEVESGKNLAWKPERQVSLPAPFTEPSDNLLNLPPPSFFIC